MRKEAHKACNREYGGFTEAMEKIPDFFFFKYYSPNDVTAFLASTE